MVKNVHNIEDIFEKIGGFGRFQIFSLLFIIYPEMPAGTLAMLPVFVGGIPDEWNCTVYNNGVPVTERIGVSDLCSCNGTLNGGRGSIVSEWNLVCENAWVPDFITSIQMVGMFIGGLLGSQVADWIGRKKTLYSSCLLILIAGAASGASPSPFFYAVTRFVIGVNIASNIISYMVVGAIYPMEFFTPKYRSLSGTIGPWGEGVMLLALLAYLFPTWQTLSWVSSLPMTLVFLSLPFMPESPRWLLSKGKLKEAKQVFDQISRWNGCEQVELSVVEAVAAGLEKQRNESSSRTAYIRFLTNRKFFLKMLTFAGIWFSCSLIFYGVGFGAKSLSGDIYLNIVYIGLIDTVAYPASVPVISWMGRRKATIGYCILAAAPLVGIILMELGIGIPTSSVARVALTLTSRIFVDGCWSTIRCFTAESFPTSMRSSAVGISQVAVAVGGIVAPQIVFLGTMYPAIPYFIFGGFSVTSAFLSFFLRETKGNPIEENEV